MKNNALGLLIVRLSLGVLMLLHGISKVINGVGGIQGMLEDKGLPGFLAYGVYLGEILAPLMLIVGFRTRIAALLYVPVMLVAMFVANGDKVFQLAPTGAWALELQALFLFGAIALFFTGGGKYAVSTHDKWD